MRKKFLGELVFAATLIASSSAYAAVIDFETIPGFTPVEGLSISNQFLASNGVSFSLSDGSSPVLAEVGAPTTAFAGPPNNSGSDNPASGQNIGSFFLTDDGSLSGLTSPALIVTYSDATSAASGVILDIDFDESFTISLFDSVIGGTLLDTISINAGDAGTGDGIASLWSFDRGSADVFRLEFQGTRTAAGQFGLGFDNFDAQNAAVAPVPLPAGLPLMLSGLLGVGLLARRKKAT